MADLRRTRDSDARPTRRPVLVAAPLALAATASAVTLGIVLQGSDDAPTVDPAATTAAAPAVADPGAAVPSTTATTPAAAPTAPPTPAPEGAERAPVLSRSDARGLGPLQLVQEKKPNLVSEVATRKAIREAKKADNQLWVTDELNLWTRPGENADRDGELEAGREVLVTGRRLWGRVEVVFQGRSRWVTEGYLSEDEPLGAGAAITDSPCAETAIEGGLSSSADLVYRSVCNAFPDVSAYGGYANRGEHASGNAIDIMTGSYELGTAIAEFLRANAAELDLYNVIYRQRIFTQERAGEGWRGMADRGSATANHMDHVHVSTY